MARVKNRFGLTSQTDLGEILYRRPRPITNDPRLIPVPVISSPTYPLSVPRRASGAGYGASS